MGEENPLSNMSASVGPIEDRIDPLDIAPALIAKIVNWKVTRVTGKDKCADETLGPVRTPKFS